MPSDVIIRRLDIDHDAQKLADMWNASNFQWPGSFNMGVPFTADFVKDWHEEIRSLAIFIAEVDGQIAGYASYMDGQSEGHEGEGYLELLNVDPRFQGKSIGRKLIQATIDLAVEKEYDRQTLHTWSGNFKAVPTYKKTGHFWTPNRSPWMQNFVPGALRMPLAKPFFAKHNWYDSYVRDLEQIEDDQRWEGCKVYTQHWEADGDALTIWIDREARAPLAVETDDLLVAGLLSEIEPVGGTEITMTWRVANKTAEDISCWLLAKGDKGLDLDYRDVFAVPAGAMVERSATVQVAVDAPASKDDGTAPAVHTQLRVNDQEIDLYAGARTKKPLAIDIAPGNLSTMPGVPVTTQVQLHNERAEDTLVKLQVTLPNGASSDWQSQEITVPATSHISVPISLTGKASAVYDIPLCAAMPDIKLDALSETLTLFCVSPGGILAKESGNVRIETNALRIDVSSEGGSLAMVCKTKDRKMLDISPNVGPPYWSPNEFGKRKFETALEEITGGYRVKMSAETRHYKGLYLRQTLDITAAGVAILQSWLENRSPEAITKRIHLGIGTFDREVERAALPLDEGIIVTRRSEFPASDLDSPRAPSDQAEPWLAWEHEGIVAGVAWDKQMGRMWHSWSIEMNSADMTVEPGQCSPKMTHLLYVGQGDWRDVRERALCWRGLWQVDPQSIEPRHPHPRGIVNARVEPTLVATLGDNVSARLVADSVSRCPTDGETSLVLPSDITASKDSFSIDGLVKGSPLEQNVTFKLAQRPGVYRGEAMLSLDMMTQAQPFDIVRLGTGGGVSVNRATEAGQPIWEIDNGLTQFALAPKFGPSLVSWRLDGENQLWSAFPEPQGFAYVYPWFGGLQTRFFEPSTWLWQGTLHNSTTSVAERSHTDANGLTWQGVRLSAKPLAEKLEDMAVEIDYQTLGGSNVLRIAMRVRNLRGTEQRVASGITLAAQLGAERPQDLVTCGEGWQHGAVPWGRSIAGERWATLVNPVTGRSMILVSQTNDVGIQHRGQHGRTIGSLPRLRLSANATVERIYYIALTDSPEMASAYACLSNY